MKNGQWMVFLFSAFLVSTLASGCAVIEAPAIIASKAFSPWKKSQIKYRPWVAPNVRLKVWEQSYYCGSYEQKKTCFDYIYSVKTSTRSIPPDYIMKHYWQDIVFWGFKKRLEFETDPGELSRALKSWRQKPSLNSAHCGAVPLVINYVSYNPSIIIYYDDKKCQHKISAGVLKSSWPKSSISSENQLKKLFLQFTEKSELVKSTSKLAKKKIYSARTSGSRSTRFELPEKRYFLEKREQGYFTATTKTNKTPKLWIARLDEFDKPPQEISFKQNRFYYRIDNNDILNVFKNGRTIEVFRTQNKIINANEAQQPN